MAGHSKWANIQHRKGRQDAIRSKLFSKLAKEITVAAKMGDPDPDKNPRLRLAVKEAKASSVPKDVIDRAIKKSQGGDAENYDEIRYEGYGPNGIAIMVEAMTDNRNRTASDVRSVFTKAGGNLAETGAVAFMFDRVGIVEFDAKAASDDALGYVFPRDYTLVMSRILIANKEADHPNAAKLWIDYLLSQRGQTVLANASRLHAIRDDVEGENTAARLKQMLGASERPIAVGPALIGYLNNQNYRDFILQWKKALSGS